MNKLHVTCLSLAVAAAMTSPVAFGYDKTYAIEDCQAKILSDDEYRQPNGVKAEETGRNSYKITGFVKDQDNQDHVFNCRVEHREVVSWNINPKGLSESDKKAAMVGAGIVGLALLAAAIKGDKDHDDKQSSYDRGENSPFDDMGYLKKECARELRRHLDQDHGQVRDLDLTHPNLHDRTLTGNGWVSFERGGHRDLSFTCEFDRRGRINDGYYNYRGGAEERRGGRGDEDRAPSLASGVQGGIPFFNATCPGGIEVHADQGGPVFFNGKETRLKKVNDTYFEATGANITLSIAINPDGSPNLSYTGRHGANGVCTVSN